MSNLWFNIRFGTRHWQWGPDGMSWRVNPYFMENVPQSGLKYTVCLGESIMKRIKFGKNYNKDGWYFVLGISFVPEFNTYQWTLTFELGLWHLEIGFGRKL
jgi:hypothetical protein